MEDSIVRFEQRVPSPQTAVDVFRDRWACDLSPLLEVTGTGANLLFTHDKRPLQVAERFGGGGLLQGMNLLEIGPLEGAHTWKFEQLGAESIVAVEASAEAWLKCLIVKELLGLTRARFLLGDALAYLQEERRRFDIVMCSGVLYHMADPLELIEQIATVSDRCFVWTHYYHPDRHPVEFAPATVVRNGEQFTYWRHTYGDRSVGFWGGNQSTAVWMSREDLLRAFELFGLDKIAIVDDEFQHPNGPAFTFAASG